MQEISFMTQTLSILILLIICGFTKILSKKINFPYTVLLLIIGLLLVPISYVEAFAFIDDFKLTPNILFFVFLPILLFEAAYNINYRMLFKNWKAIGLLAVLWLLISWSLIAVSLYYFLPFTWLNVPFLICLMFWVLISATDPVAVLAIFKKLWAPRRLTILFEWESLFNDGTAVAIFVVILSLVIDWWTVTWSTYFEWIYKFASMLVWWILFWSFTWVLFSKIIWYINNNEEVEIVLTMLVAHVTFILAEIISHNFFLFPISWVIATVVASIIIWNYGRYKITPRVEVHMQKFWEFFAFISNSIIFILMWLILSTVNVDLYQFILPLIISIIVVMIARVVSVYIPIWIVNFFRIEEHIPMTWVKLLSWWSLRWALALMMILMIPWIWDSGYEGLMAFQKAVWWTYDFSIKEFLLVLTIWSIMFTMFVKATTTPLMMKQLKVDKLHKLEEFKYEEWIIIANLKILEKISSSFKKAYLTMIEYEELKSKYVKMLNDSIVRMKKLLWSEPTTSKILIRRAVSLHALWIEKENLRNLFYYNEIDEHNFKYIIRKIDRQIERIEQDYSQLKYISDRKWDYDIFSKIIFLIFKRKSTELDAYIRNRARVIITRKVIKELRVLKEIEFWFDNEIFDEVIYLYSDFNKKADEKRIKIFTSHKATINAIESKLVNKSLLKLKEEVVKDLFSKEIITPKLFIRFMTSIEDEMYSDLKKLV